MRQSAIATAGLVLLLAGACTRRAPAPADGAGARPVVEIAAKKDLSPASVVGAPDAGSDAALAPSTARAAQLEDALAGGDDAGASRIDAASALVSGVPEGPFGVARLSPRAGCAAFAGSGVSPRDVETSFADGEDLLAIVNRAPTGQLPPDWAPSDLVEIRTGEPMTARACERTQCLRRDAAAALGELLAEMRKEGFPGKIESAFRSYGAQCGTFGRWAQKSSFCKATEQSALPGHSQHQLGTTVDVFTEAWARDPRGSFRNGFGCTDGGRFLRARAADFGFVMPYPIHADDRHPRQDCTTRWDIHVDINPRTGYRYEHWHFRYVGKEAAARFEAARVAGDLGGPNELTLEQWLRAERGIAGADAELPVCDGCNCGACSTLAPLGESACDRAGGALHLGPDGAPVFGDVAPTLEGAAATRARGWQGRVVEVKLEVPAGTITQTPIVGTDAAGYEPGASFERLAPYPGTEPRAFAPLAGAWVVGVEPVPNETGAAWPYRAGISSAAVARVYNRANVLLPTRGGKTVLRVPVPAAVRQARVVLLRGGAPFGEPRVVDLD